MVSEFQGPRYSTMYDLLQHKYRLQLEMIFWPHVAARGQYIGVLKYSVQGKGPSCLTLKAVLIE